MSNSLYEHVSKIQKEFTALRKYAGNYKVVKMPTKQHLCTRT